MQHNINRITTDMSVPDIITIMSEGNSEALDCLTQILKSGPLSLSDVLLMDTVGIYGKKIHTLWNDCCNRDMVKFSKTIEIFKENKFTLEEIHENLSQDCPKSFI